MIYSTISRSPVERLDVRRGCAANDGRTAAAPSRARARTRSDFTQYRTRWSANVVPLAFGIAAAVTLWIGWLKREDSGLTPQSGAGYWLGIVGSSLMVLLLPYP